MKSLVSSARRTSSLFWWVYEKRSVSMSRVKLDQEALGYSSVLEQLTHAQVKDCFKDEEIVYFVLAEGDLGKAIGKGGSMINRMKELLQKNVRLLEYKSTVQEFIRSVIYPLKVAEIVVEESGVIVLKDEDRKTKGLLIGRDGKNIKMTNKIVKRFFDVPEIKVV